MAASTQHDDSGLSVAGARFAYPAPRRRPAPVVLAGLDLDVEPGQRVALLGPNGSGKSTLIKVIGGLLPLDAGRVTLFGLDDPARFRPWLSVVFQFIGLDRHLTVWENLRDQAVLYGVPRREARTRITRALEQAGLLDRRRDTVKTLSRGLARRADLARAMLHRPRLLMLDEPTAGLDPTARRVFVEQVLERQDGGPSMVLFSTHLVDEAERCDRVVMLHRGGIVADGPPQALRERYAAAPQIMIRTGASEPPPIAGLSWTRSIIGFFTATSDDAEVVKRAAARLTDSGLGFSISPTSTPTLDEIFERLTGTRLAGEPPAEGASDG